jgi:hypothetical protein
MRPWDPRERGLATTTDSKRFREFCSGTSHLARVRGHADVGQRHDVFFTTQTQLVRTLSQAKAIGT